MGWYYRKSVGLGPFRINISKSGIGYSLGGGGFRTGVNSRGRRYARSASLERECGTIRRQSRAASWSWPCFRESVRSLPFFS